MVVSAADFRVPFSKSHFWLADKLGLTSGSDSDTASRNCARRGPLFVGRNNYCFELCVHDSFTFYRSHNIAICLGLSDNL